MRILIACDGSELSQQAIRFLRTIPFVSPEVTLLHVVAPVIYDSYEITQKSREKIDAFNKDLYNSGRKILDEAEDLIKGYSVTLHRKLLSGVPKKLLMQESCHFDLIVMGARGLNPLESILLGSVADFMLRHANCSLLLFRSLCQTEDNHGFRISFAYDGSDESMHSLKISRYLDSGKVMTAELLCMMKKNFYFAVNYSMEELNLWSGHETLIQDRLKKAIDILHHDLPGVEVQQNLHRDVCDVAASLAKFASEKKSDLLIISPHKKDFLDRVLLGSVSSRLSHQATLPILFYRHCKM
ncbi:MAG: universal stress protein [Deltaproteobacteria bacterium]|nr:universal stress protein [Deltaproteobacteria bacterium]